MHMLFKKPFVKIVSIVLILIAPVMMAPQSVQAEEVLSNAFFQYLEIYLTTPSIESQEASLGGLSAEINTTIEPIHCTVSTVSFIDQTEQIILIANASVAPGGYNPQLLREQVATLLGIDATITVSGQLNVASGLIDIDIQVAFSIAPYPDSSLSKRLHDPKGNVHYIKSDRAP